MTSYVHEVMTLFGTITSRWKAGKSKTEAPSPNNRPKVKAARKQSRITRRKRK